MSSMVVGAFQNLAYKLSCQLPNSDGAFTSSEDGHGEPNDRVTLGEGQESWTPSRPNFSFSSSGSDYQTAARAAQDKQLALGAASVITGVPLFDWPT
jgi:hypothetical protein